MQITRHPLRCLTRFAIAILVMAAMAPSISRLLAHVTTTATPWQIVCATVPAGQQPTDDAARMATDCALCLLQAQAMAPPPAPPSLAVAAPLGTEVPRLFLHAPRPLFAWASARSRAPPLVA